MHLSRWALLLVLSGLTYGQAVDKSLTFDVASVKPAAPLVPDGRGRIMFQGPQGGPGSKDPGRIRYPFMSLKNLLTTAYDVKGFQIVGPAWLDTERFDITATMPPETTKEQFHVMLQNLLVERFKMTLHRETKELPTYSLVVAKGGPKLTESAEPPPTKKEDGDASPPPPPSMPKMGPDGFPVMTSFLGGRAGLFNVMMPGRARMIAQQQTTKDLAARLSDQLSRPVTDNTGLTKKYDFTLTFLPEQGMGPMGPMPPPPPPPGGAAGAGPMGPASSDAEAPPSIFAAIQSQLGLKLEPKKGPVEQIVIDHIERTPIEN